MPLTVAQILQLYAEQGNLPYGDEPVSQLEHALQCATLAETAAESPEMILACLLHDLGHLLHHLGRDVGEQGIDDRHEYRVIPYLKPLFEPAVLEPIRLHVQAKRYLCAVDPDYWSRLSEVSKTTLNLQGQIFSEAEAEAFMAQPYAKEAVQLRLYDDHAKQLDYKTPDLAHFTDLLYACCAQL